MNLLVRWTIGDVSTRGFDALALSIEGARRIFGPSADYVVGVNTIPVDAARNSVGSIAAAVEWVDVSDAAPAWLAEFVDEDFGGGMLWKLVPVRMGENAYELSLDNDVILWKMPPSIVSWLDDGESLLIAQDVEAHYGDLAFLCGPEPRNAGIRGLPPGLDAAAEIHELLVRSGRKLTHICDEQGLQVALVAQHQHFVVPLDEVAVCGYFRPHLLELGTCGAHFVGVNSKKLPWEWQGRSGEEYVHEYWDSRRPEVEERLRSPEHA